jgi:hypothetical protein
MDGPGGTIAVARIAGRDADTVRIGRAVLRKIGRLDVVRARDRERDDDGDDDEEEVSHDCSRISNACAFRIVARNAGGPASRHDGDVVRIAHEPREARRVVGPGDTVWMTRSG